MTELNVKIDINTLPNLIDVEIENFRHYQVSMNNRVLDVFHHVPTNNLFYIGRQFAEALEYKDVEKSLKTNTQQIDRIHLKHARANKLLSLEINSLANPGFQSGVSDNSLILKDNIEIPENYKLSPNGCLFIAEEGAMDLLMDSHKPEAKAFRRKLIDIAVTIRQTGSYAERSGSYGIPKIQSSTTELTAIASAMTTMATNSSELVKVNSTIAKLLDTVDKLKDDVKIAIHKRLGDFANQMSTTSCIKNKTAFVSRTWNHTTTIVEAICQLVQYSHSQNTLLQAKADDSRVDSMWDTVRPALHNLRGDVSQLKNKISDLEDEIICEKNRADKLQQKVTDLVLDNLAVHRAEIDALKGE